MQLDLRSVEKVPVRSHDLCPGKSWKLVFLASELFGVFSKIYPELFPVSPGAPLQEITVSTFSIQLGQIRLQFVHRIKKTFFAIRFDPIGKCNRI